MCAGKRGLGNAHVEVYIRVEGDAFQNSSVWLWCACERHFDMHKIFVGIRVYVGCMLGVLERKCLCAGHGCLSMENVKSNKEFVVNVFVQWKFLPFLYFLENDVKEKHR